MKDLLAQGIRVTTQLPDSLSESLGASNRGAFQQEIGLKSRFDKRIDEILDPDFGINPDPRDGGPASGPGGFDKYMQDKSQIDIGASVAKLTEALEQFEKSGPGNIKNTAARAVVSVLENERNKGAGQGVVLKQILDQQQDPEAFKARLKNVLDYYDSNCGGESSYEKYLGKVIQDAIVLQNQQSIASLDLNNLNSLLTDHIKAPLSWQGDFKSNHLEFFKRLLSTGSSPLSSQEDRAALFEKVNIEQLSMPDSFKRALQILKSGEPDSDLLLGKALATIMPAQAGSFENDLNYELILPAVFAGVGRGGGELKFWQAYSQSLKEQGKFKEAPDLDVKSEKDLVSARDFFNRQLANLANKDQVINSIAEAGTQDGSDNLVGFTDFSVLKNIFQKASTNPPDQNAANLVAAAFLHVQNHKPEELLAKLNPDLAALKLVNPSLALILEAAKTGEHLKVVGAIKEHSIFNDAPALFKLVNNSLTADADHQYIDKSHEAILKNAGISELPKDEKGFIDYGKLIYTRLVDKYKSEKERQDRVREFFE